METKVRNKKQKKPSPSKELEKFYQENKDRMSESEIAFHYVHEYHSRNNTLNQLNTYKF